MHIHHSTKMQNRIFDQFITTRDKNQGNGHVPVWLPVDTGKSERIRIHGRFLWYLKGPD
jgi:hypothetical protein